MNKLHKTLCVVMSVLIVIVPGCKKKNPQSKQIQQLKGMAVALANWQELSSGDYADFWDVGGDNGEDIYSIGFVTELQIQKKNKTQDTHKKAMKASGYKVSIKIDNVYPVPGTSTENLWTKKTSHGKFLGFLTCVQGEEISYELYDEENNLGELLVYTDDLGKMAWAVGAGNPDCAFQDYERDHRYKLPDEASGGSNLGMSCIVEYTISIPDQPSWWPDERRIPSTKGFVSITRVNDQPFFKFKVLGQWSPGVINMSYQGLGEINKSPSMQMAKSEASFEGLTNLSSLALGKASKEQFELGDVGDMEIVRTDSAKRVMAATSEDSPINIMSSKFYQPRYSQIDPNSPPQLGLWELGEDDDLYHFIPWNTLSEPGSDPSDPNHVLMPLTNTTPYCLVVDVTFPEGLAVNPGDKFTTHLCAYTDPNDLDNVAGREVLGMTVHSVGAGNATIVSDWIVFSPDATIHGPLTDLNGVKYTCIHLDEEWLVGLEFPDPFGDFNASGVVDLDDFAILSAHWGESPGDPGWEPMMFNGYDPTLPVGVLQLQELSEDWLEE